jgi:transaldolase
MKTKEAKTSIEKLESFGQSVWLDYIQRSMIRSGQLKNLIEHYGIRGVTSNPAIFEKAIDESNDYDDDIKRLISQGKNAQEIYEILTVQDIQQAADVFRPLYDRTQGQDGYVSLEVSPHIAHETETTIKEARKLWKKVGRPNVLIKIPATAEGLPAIRQCISEGINVNITLIFGLPIYMKVANAYIEGLELRLAQGQSIKTVASVASFFLSRIDVLVDKMLENEIERGNHPDIAQSLHGQIAISCAKVAYQMYKEIFGEERFRKLAGKGARPQRLLWASTSTKNPSYSDIKYVEPLIGPQTVNTMPMVTVEAYQDHGKPAGRLEEDAAQADHLLALLSEVGMSLDKIADQLEAEGIEKFIKPYDSLISKLNEKARERISD